MARKTGRCYMVWEWLKLGKTWITRHLFLLLAAFLHICTWRAFPGLAWPFQKRLGNRWKVWPEVGITQMDASPINALFLHCILASTRPACGPQWKIQPLFSFPWGSHFAAILMSQAQLCRISFIRITWRLTSRPLCRGHMWADQMSGGCRCQQDWQRNMWWLKVSGKDQGFPLS